MKILFVGVFNEESTNVSQKEAFERLGQEVITYNYRSRQKVIGPYDRDMEIVKKSKDLGVDFILFSKCNEISIETIIKCNKHTKTILWYMDCMNNFNASLISKIKYCHSSFFAHPKTYEEARYHSKNAYYLSEGYDENIDKPIDLKQVYSTSFIGDIDSDRKEYTDQLIVYGFHNFNKSFGIDHARAVCKSKINLNFVRDNSGPSDRIYKIMAAGGFLLTQPWKNMEKDFEVDMDFSTFTNVESLKEKCCYFLEHEYIRDIIAKHGHNTNEKFTRTNWAKFILEGINYE